MNGYCCVWISRCVCVTPVLLPVALSNWPRPCHPSKVQFLVRRERIRLRTKRFYAGV